MRDYEEIAGRSAQADIYTWNDLAGNPPGDPHEFDWTLAAGSTHILEGEFVEYMEAVDNRDEIEYYDALADIVVVAYGEAWKQGVSLDAFVHEAMRANWTKADPVSGEFIKIDNKIQKGANYVAPDMDSVLEAERYGMPF